MSRKVQKRTEIMQLAKENFGKPAFLACQPVFEPPDTVSNAPPGPTFPWNARESGSIDSWCKRRSSMGTEHRSSWRDRLRSVGSAPWAPLRSAPSEDSERQQRYRMISGFVSGGGLRLGAGVESVESIYCRPWFPKLESSEMVAFRRTNDSWKRHLCGWRLE